MTLASSAGRPVRIGLVSEFPPPGAGMTVQAETLRRRLTEDGLDVVAVRTNPPLRGALRPLGGVRFVRGLIAWCRYAWALRLLARVDLVHVFAISWLSFFLFAAPAVAVGRFLGRGVVVHFHGGNAAPFMHRLGWLALPFLRAAHRFVVPSSFLREVFSPWGLEVDTIDNPVDAARVEATSSTDDPVVLSCRNLGPVYAIGTAIEAFALFSATSPAARMIVAGDGPERGDLERQAKAAGLQDRIEFLGNVEHDDMAAVRSRATILLNTSRVDNQPVSLIEAMAAGLPIVSTDAGGIPCMVRNEAEALLSPVGDAASLARGLQRAATDAEVRDRVIAGGLARARAYRWAEVRQQWYRVYGELLQHDQRPEGSSLESARRGRVRS